MSENIVSLGRYFLFDCPDEEMVILVMPNGDCCPFTYKIYRNSNDFLKGCIQNILHRGPPPGVLPVDWALLYIVNDYIDVVEVFTNR